MTRNDVVEGLGTPETPKAVYEVVFLDRDGVINIKRPDGEYVTRWDEFAFLPGAKEALSLLGRAGTRLFVVTNQRGVARGLMSLSELERIHDRMVEELALRGVTLEGVYVCPHGKGECDCRKPGVGLFLNAQREHPEIHFARSAVVGDSLSDMQAAVAVGSNGFFVGTEHEWDRLKQGEHADVCSKVKGVGSSLIEVTQKWLIHEVGIGRR